ncbi:MAG: hypothetical protein QNI84_01785 [Henriciella sp.]|nr:hypothetical protein [Henriciella sp.]
MRLLAIFTCFVAVLLLACVASAQVNDRTTFAVEGIVVVWGADSAGQSPIVSDFIINDSNVARGDTDLIAGDVASVVTGTLLPAFDGSSLDEVPSRMFNVRNSPNGNGDIDSNGNGVTDGGDVFNAFEMGPNTRLGLRDSVSRSSFYVASNVPFNIDGEAIRVVGRDDWVLGKIFWAMSVTQSGNDGIAFGANAQLPHSGGPTGGIGAVDDLLEMMTPTTLFTGNQRTAASRGSLPEQSVRFDVVYTLGSWQGYSLSTNHTNLAEGIYEVEAEVVYTVWVP